MTEVVRAIKRRKRPVSAAKPSPVSAPNPEPQAVAALHDLLEHEHERAARARSQIRGTARETIFHQIHEERRRQDSQWGGENHDNEHSRRVWTGVLKEHLDRAAKLSRSRSASSSDSYRHRLVVIASLCVAAIEAHDRGGRSK